MRRTYQIVAISAIAILIGAGTMPSWAAEKGGAQLWSENCMMCHNLRSPSTLSAKQWEIAVGHMRVQANLTAKDARKILEFLKSSSGNQ